MLPAEYQDLILKLVERSEAGLVNWHPTSDERQYVVYFEHFSLSVQMYQDYANTEICDITIRDSTAKVVDRFSLIETNINEWNLAQRMFASARRKALRIDEALDTIRRELDNNQTIGLPNAPKEIDDDDIPF